MRLFELTEKIRNIDADVEYIFQKGKFQDILDDIHRGKEPNITEIVISSSELMSPDSMKAHKLNPIEIICHSHEGHNRYIPLEQEIHLNLIGEVSKFSSQMGNPHETSKYMEPRQGIRLLSELSEGYYKGVIMHELAHWIDDSLNNKHIQNKTTKANYSAMVKGSDPNKELSKVLTGTEDSVSEFSPTEIEGQIHTIVQVKRQMTQDQWDSLTFSQMMDLVPIIGDTYEKMGTKGRDKWLKRIISRMNREDILGKRMR